MNQRLQPVALSTQAAERNRQTPARRTYTRRQICAKLNDLPARTFFALKKQGKLPLVEVNLLTRAKQYDALVFDRWFERQFGGRGR